MFTRILEKGQKQRTIKKTNITHATKEFNCPPKI